MEGPECGELQIIKRHYKKALECFNTGMLEENAGNKGRAIVLYRLGRRHLLQGKEMASRQNYGQQIPLKMNEMLSNITTRLAVLESASATGSSGTQNCFPVPQATDGHVSISQSMRKTHSSLTIPALAFSPQDVLLFLPHGVQIFFVTPDGKVSSPSYPGYLRIILNSSQHYDNDTTDTRRPLAYLQVCDWHYSLFPDLPVLLSNTGMFTFPDTTAAVPGSCVGVVLSSELPARDRTLFHEHLSLFTQLRVQSAGDYGADEETETGRDINSVSAHTDSGKEEKKYFDIISQNITAGASWLSEGLVQRGEATGKAIHNGASKLRKHITPQEKPTEVSPRVITGLHVAQQTTRGAVKVSRFLVNGLSSVVGHVGKELTPHAKKHGSKLIPESLKSNNNVSTKMTGVKVMAVSSIKGISIVWSGLETAAKTIGQSARSETVLTVKHKYGNEASQATDSAIQSVTNVGITAFNMDNIVLNAVMNCTSKQMSKAVEEQDMNPVKKEKEKIRNVSLLIQASSV